MRGGVDGQKERKHRTFLARKILGGGGLQVSNERGRESGRGKEGGRKREREEAALN